jgi:hypothetical protein
VDSWLDRLESKDSTKKGFRAQLLFVSLLKTDMVVCRHSLIGGGGGLLVVLVRSLDSSVQVVHFEQ